MVREERERHRMEYEARKYIQGDTFFNKDVKEYVEPRQFSIY